MSVSDILKEQIDRSYLPDWVLGTYLPVDIVDVEFGHRTIKMVPIAELRTRLVTPYIVDDTLSYRQHTSSNDALIDSYYIDHPEAIADLVTKQSGQPIVSLANLREFICYRFSPMDGTHYIGTNIFSYAALLKDDNHIKYKSRPKEEYQIPATSADMAYFAAWIFKNIWHFPTYLFLVTSPVLKAYCIVYTCGWWNPIYNRNIAMYIEDNKFKTVDKFVEWLKVSPCARNIAFTHLPDDNDDLVWRPYDKKYFDNIQKGLL